MVRRVRALALSVVLATGLLALIPVSAGADATELLAEWQMNEGPNASIMTDSSGNDIHGAIGDAVVTGQTQGGDTYYTWPNTQPNQPPPKPERLIFVDDDRLNPGDDDFAVTMRFRTTRPFGNMIQKGQSNNPGGNWKWQMPSGELVCVFTGIGADGEELTRAVNSGDARLGFEPLNDGEWHVARCERRGDQLILTVDPGTPNQRIRRANGPTGRIFNNVPMTIAGKPNCDQIITTCDYYVGDIDYVYIHTGPRGEQNDPPNANASGGCAFLECGFSASGSFDSDGTIESYAWDFGDGETGSGFSPSYTYDSPGLYEVTLQVTDDDGATDTDTVMVTATSAPPDAAFSATCEFRDCSFDASASFDPDGTVTLYEWDFGDGDSATGVAPDHTYTDPGDYTVTLTVTDNHGETDSASEPVAATNQLPVASFAVDCNTQVCAFDATASLDPDGTIVSYTWDFGDGSGGSGSTADHVYAAAGTFDVTLTVTDNHGGIGDITDTVTVTEAAAVHLHDLKPSPYDLDGDKWVARLVVKVRDAGNAPAEGVEVTVNLGNKGRTCTTNAAGKCKVKIKVDDARPKLPAEVTAVDWVGGYDPAANRDKDGDGNGETVLVWRPF